MENIKVVVNTLEGMGESLAEVEGSVVELEQAVEHLDSEKVNETKYENVTAQSEIIDSLEHMPELTGITEKVDLAGMRKKDLLPQITGKETHVVLTKTQDYFLNMQLCVDTASLRSDGCRMYLSKVDTGEVYLSENAEIKVSREKILMAVDHSVMNVISNFIVNFTEDDKKVAFERAKKYLEIASNATDISSSRGILNILKDVVAFTMNAAVEEETSGISEGIVNELYLCVLHPNLIEYTAATKSQNADTKCVYYKYKVDIDAGTIAVIADHFQKVLDAVDAGCTKTVFCKKLRILEAHYGKKIIISNRNGSGFGFNDTNNRRYYKFRIIEGIWRSDR